MIFFVLWLFIQHWRIPGVHFVCQWFMFKYGHNECVSFEPRTNGPKISTAAPVQHQLPWGDGNLMTSSTSWAQPNRRHSISNQLRKVWLQNNRERIPDSLGSGSKKFWFSIHSGGLQCWISLHLGKVIDNLLYHADAYLNSPERQRDKRHLHEWWIANENSWCKL